MDISMRVGDYITDAFGIYRVSKMPKDGDEVRLYYISAIKSDKDCISYLPLKNLKKANLRKVVSRQEVSAIIKKISTNNLIGQYDFKSAKEEIYNNDWERLVPIINFIWINQNNLPKGDRDLMNLMVDNISREAAFVTKDREDKVRQEIWKRLKRLGQKDKEEKV